MQDTADELTHQYSLFAVGFEMAGCRLSDLKFYSALTGLLKNILLFSYKQKYKYFKRGMSHL